MIRRFSAWADRNPLLAVYIGLLAALLITLCAAPMLVRHGDAPVHMRGAT